MSKLKVLDKKSEKSIKSERDFLSKLNNPFIVNMHYAFQDADNLYLVMDLLSGGDLRFHISRHKKFTEEQTRFFICGIIISLEYIHSNNVIHRDIKPENLVLDEKGYVRVTDFGIAKENLPDNKSETSGTPGYMSPEVLKGLNHSFPVDFFALGVIGYEFMKGERPYTGRNRKEIREQIMAKQAEIKNDDICPGWSKESADFINKLLIRKPENRIGYKGIFQLKEHPWLKYYPWDLLINKILPSPFIPENIDNFDRRYCESTEIIGDETKSRYQDILLDENKKDIFNKFYFDIDEEIRKKKLLEESKKKENTSSKTVRNNVTYRQGKMKDIKDIKIYNDKKSVDKNSGNNTLIKSSAKIIENNNTNGHIIQKETKHKKAGSVINNNLPNNIIYINFNINDSNITGNIYNNNHNIINNIHKNNATINNKSPSNQLLKSAQQENIKSDRNYNNKNTSKNKNNDNILTNSLNIDKNVNFGNIISHVSTAKQRQMIHNSDENNNNHDTSSKNNNVILHKKIVKKLVSKERTINKKENEPVNLGYIYKRHSPMSRVNNKNPGFNKFCAYNQFSSISKTNELYNSENLGEGVSLRGISMKHNATIRNNKSKKDPKNKNNDYIETFLVDKKSRPRSKIIFDTINESKKDGVNNNTFINDREVPIVKIQEIQRNSNEDYNNKSNYQNNSGSKKINNNNERSTLTNRVINKNLIYEKNSNSNGKNNNNINNQKNMKNNSSRDYLSNKVKNNIFGKNIYHGRTNSSITGGEIRNKIGNFVSNSNFANNSNNKSTLINKINVNTSNNNGNIRKIKKLGNNSKNKNIEDNVNVNNSNIYSSLNIGINSKEI